MRKTAANLNTASGFHIAMILLGIAVTPVLLSSSSLGNQLSSSNLITVVLLGGLILTVLAAITISVGEKARLPTYGIVKYAFGERGAIAINVLMAISLFGWITVTANMFGHSVHDLLAQHGLTLPVPLLVAAGSVIFVASTAFGFAVLGRVAQIAVPIIALMLCYILYIATQSTTSVPDTVASMNTGVAVSTVVGTIIVLVATLPDFGSFVHDRKHALIAAIIAFLVAYPLLYWAGATPSALSGQGSLLGAMAVFGAVLPAALLLIFACVTGNAGNLFQGTLVLSTLLGSLDIMAWFIPFLLFLGIATPPVAGIYIADFFLYRQNGYQETVLSQEPAVKLLTFAAWILGAIVGFLTVKGVFTLTTIPSLDSILVACVAYALLSRVNQRR